MVRGVAIHPKGHRCQETDTRAHNSEQCSDPVELNTNSAVILVELQKTATYYDYTTVILVVRVSSSKGLGWRARGWPGPSGI